GGRHWQDFLSNPGHPYLEIQSGMTPTQSNGLVLPAHSAREWMQIFGYFESDPARVHDTDYARACAHVGSQLQEQMPAARLAALREAARAAGDQAPDAILYAASGWGALEMARRATVPGLQEVPAAFAFPESTLGAEQERWLQLLREGAFADADPAQIPDAWVVQPEWLPLLAAAERNWFVLLHEGVMRLENGDLPGAVQAWQESLAAQPSPWALRNLAVAATRSGDEAKAQVYYEEAWALAVALGVNEAALAVECLQSLVAQRRFAEGHALYNGLPESLRDVDRIQILRGRIALELGDLETVALVLQREYAVVREGETELSDQWTAMWMQREAAASGRPQDAALRRVVRAAHPLPANINFLMFEHEE
ncbi:MAG: tetratricopeptide repeat protein, partial [Caldilineaceae bacterium]